MNSISHPSFSHLIVCPIIFSPPAWQLQYREIYYTGIRVCAIYTTPCPSIPAHFSYRASLAVHRGLIERSLWQFAFIGILLYRSHPFEDIFDKLLVFICHLDRENEQLVGVLVLRHEKALVMTCDVHIN